MSKFKFLMGDVNWADYGGKWWRKVAEGRYHVIELINWREHVGEDEAPATYNVDLSEVDLGAASDKMVNDVFESCGWDGDEEWLQDEKARTAATVEAMHGYGYKSPLWSQDGNNYSKLLSEAKAESRRLDDPDAHEEAMNRPVNKLGSTAREFGQGDMHSAMVRGVANGDTSAKIIAKMYGASEEAIATVEGSPIPVAVSFSVKLNKVPSDDPLAYTMGFTHAMAGQGLDDNRSDLADAYIKGYRLGVDVKAGRESHPDWC